MKNRATTVAALASAVWVCGLAASAQATPVYVAVPTIQLTGSQSNVAWHPVYQRYYSSTTGYPQGTVYIHDASGAVVDTHTPTGVDPRTWSYNSITGDLELQAYGSGSGGGVFTYPLTATGNIDAGPTQLQVWNGVWDFSVLDAARNRHYSLVGNNTVVIRSRTTGQPTGMITLDLTGLGTVDTTDYMVGYDADLDLLVTTDSVGKRALFHNIDGTLAKVWQLPASAPVPSGYFMGYANGQVFVSGQGYAIPEPSALALAIPAAALLGRRRASRHGR